MQVISPTNTTSEHTLEDKILDAVDLIDLADNRQAIIAVLDALKISFADEGEKSKLWQRLSAQQRHKLTHPEQVPLWREGEDD